MTPATRPPQDLPEVVRFLQRPSSYPEPTARVDLVETHFSFVFLTDHHVYKLKKRERYPFLDLSELSARHANCQEEYRLNRMLSPDIYLGVATLCRDAQGRLNLHQEGEVVDYLVHMVRLDDRTNLEHQLRYGRPRPQAVTAAADLLTDFYQRTNTREATDVTARRRQVHSQAEELLGLIDDPHVSRLRDGLLRWIGRHEDTLQGRQRVDAHGDLRPQHIYLGDPPHIIDRLEFDARLRRMDPVEELAFLALECERLGQPWVGNRFLERYVQVSGDRAPATLEPFYQASRALLWALLSARHLVTGHNGREHWLTRSRLYLELGMRNLRSAV
ncbi:MAG: hypothetical protein JJT90_10905 [Ectothiorhodospiraceae bacterium]|nr:hypothetical protein [Ectothiorhodospiraceae bacterium]